MLSHCTPDHDDDGEDVGDFVDDNDDQHLYLVDQFRWARACKSWCEIISTFIICVSHLSWYEIIRTADSASICILYAYRFDF